MRRAKGTYTITENRAAAYIKRHHDASSSVLMALTERDNYTNKGPMSVAEIMVETGLRERGTEKALARLQEAGLAVRTPDGWVYPRANDRANPVADDSANGNANEVAYGGTETEAENDVPDEENESLKEVEGSRRK